MAAGAGLPFLKGNSSMTALSGIALSLTKILVPACHPPFLESADLKVLLSEASTKLIFISTKLQRHIPLKIEKDF